MFFVVETIFSKSRIIIPRTTLNEESDEQLLVRFRSSASKFIGNYRPSPLAFVLQLPRTSQSRGTSSRSERSPRLPSLRLKPPLENRNSYETCTLYYSIFLGRCQRKLRFNTSNPRATRAQTCPPQQLLTRTIKFRTFDPDHSSTPITFSVPELLRFVRRTLLHDHSLPRSSQWIHRSPISSAQYSSVSSSY